MVIQEYSRKYDKICKTTRRKTEHFYNKMANDPAWRAAQDRIYSGLFVEDLNKYAQNGSNVLIVRKK